MWSKDFFDKGPLSDKKTIVAIWEKKEREPIRNSMKGSSF